ncbi:sensor histidine kinase [Cohnella cholangitidis]|uniref:sensor histidine kinase n=1 Tax=Cohnella cholangitidis TaxID=2598458 RepID=UPI0015FD35D8|nr:sensor histidine kinase [Cohnella cholangitidis]
MLNYPNAAHAGTESGYPAPEHAALIELLLMEERQRLAGDLHDIVGYTLTTAIVQIDAIRRLLEQNPDAGVQKLNLLQEAVRTGLEEIRKSVRSLKEGNVDFDLAAELSRLAETTKAATGANVRLELSAPTECLNAYQKKVIYYTVQEGLTNGIRHGNSTRFTLSMLCNSGNLELVLSNKGKPYVQCAPGFGLTTMQGRIASLGGTMTLTSTGEGCRLHILLPLFRPYCAS